MKKILFSFILSVMGLCMAFADESVMGIFATFDGSEVSYKLADVPIVKYDSVGDVQNAVLYLKDVAEPVLRVALTDGVQLTIVYGEYHSSTDIGNAKPDKAHITEQNGKKIIQGGKLIIIDKDGKMYNAEGIIIKK